MKLITPSLLEVKTSIHEVAIHSVWKHANGNQCVVVEISDSRMGKQVHYRQDDRVRKMSLASFKLRWNPA